jgi:MFS family permease
MVARAWLVLELTGSATWVGLTFGVQTLPMLVVGPYGGLVADRSEGRRLLIAPQLGMALPAAALAALALCGTVQLWHVLVMAAALGVAEAFEKPTRRAFVIEMVGPALVRNAVSLNSVMVNVARVICPAIAG